MGAMLACLFVLLQLETCRDQIFVNDYRHSLSLSFSDMAASSIGFAGCLFICVDLLRCRSLLIAFWMPFLLFESRKSHPYLKFEVIVTVLTIDTHIGQ